MLLPSHFHSIQPKRGTNTKTPSLHLSWPGYCHQQFALSTYDPKFQVDANKGNYVCYFEGEEPAVNGRLCSSLRPDHHQ